MTDFIEGDNRSQATLFPERLDDYITEDNAVRVIDVFIDGFDQYLAQIESVDRQEASIAKSKTERLENKITKLKKEIERLNNIDIQLQATPDKQISLTDPDSRSMKSRGAGIVGYNVQTAVDTEHHLIIAHEVTNVGSDRSQLKNMSEQAKEVIASKELSVVADRGYYNGEEIKACDDAKIKAYLPKCQTSGNQAKGLFGKRDFIY